MVCNCVIANVNATALDAETNNDRNVPAQVGHAMNSPVAAATLPMPAFLRSMENAFTAIAEFSPTKYETVICNMRLIGITCIPTCSVM